MTETATIALEIHARGESSFNAELAMDSVISFTKGQTVDIVLRARRTKLVNTKKKPCHETNDRSVSGCIDEYIQDQMGCQLPWIKGGNYESF